MKWVRDRSRRLDWRPYYAQHEIDVHCEDIVSRFLNDMGRSRAYPMSTDDLTVLIERDVSALDLYSNLSAEGRNVEGVTEFHRKKTPSVRIARYLSEQPSRENRLRSTLAHEYGHVIFHNFFGAWTAMERRRAPSVVAPLAAGEPGSLPRRKPTGWSGRRATPAAPSSCP